MTPVHGPSKPRGSSLTGRLPPPRTSRVSSDVRPTVPSRGASTSTWTFRRPNGGSMKASATTVAIPVRITISHPEPVVRATPKRPTATAANDIAGFVTVAGRGITVGHRPWSGPWDGHGVEQAADQRARGAEVGAARQHEAVRKGRDRDGLDVVGRHEVPPGQRRVRLGGMQEREAGAGGRAEQDLGVVAG